MEEIVNERGLSQNTVTFHYRYNLMVRADAFHALHYLDPGDPTRSARFTF